MTYFNFTKITPAAPNDPTVNVATQINANWDQLETKLNAIEVMPQNLTGPETGQEWVTDNPFFRVWNGSANRDPDDIDSGWGSWSNISLSTNVAARVGFTPQYRVNTLIRQVELTGGLLKDGSASAWPTGLVQATVTSSGIPIANAPFSGTSRFQTAAAVPSSAHGAAGWIEVDNSGGSFVQIWAAYAGGPGGGNFIMLNGVKWWY